MKSDFVAEVKEKLSPQCKSSLNVGLRKIERRVFEVGEKEDLKGTGFVDRSRVVGIFNEYCRKNKT